MKKTEIALNELHLDGIELTNRCMLVTAGSYETGRFNSMTISWGFVGNLWSHPMVLIAIRKSRYTNEFLAAGKDFTLTVLPQRLKKVYGLIGSQSGRDSDKMRESGLTPIQSEAVLSPSFAEASLTLECETVYADEIRKENILVPEILRENYQEDDFHKLYIGRIVRAWKQEE